MYVTYFHIYENMQYMFIVFLVFFYIDYASMSFQHAQFLLSNQIFLKYEHIITVIAE